MINSQETELRFRKSIELLAKSNVDLSPEGSEESHPPETEGLETIAGLSNADK